MLKMPANDSLFPMGQPNVEGGRSSLQCLSSSSHKLTDLSFHLCFELPKWPGFCSAFHMQLEMEDEDTIDVFQQQTGGCFL